MTEIAAPDEKRMKLRYAGRCRLCEGELGQGVEAIYERSTKTVRCVVCAVAPGPAAATVIEPGVPGASARREFERRHNRREDRVRAAHPKLGKLMLAMVDDPQSTRAWDTGAIGEERLGARLNGLAGESLRVLHDRRIPRTTANIDHLAITRSGVFVIDAKRYQGRPTLVVEGGIFRPRVEKLMVAGRDRTKLVDGMLKQVDVVRDIVGQDVPIRGVLCFIEANFPLLGGAFTTRGVDILWPKRLYPQLVAGGALDPAVIDSVHRTLAAVLPAA